MGLGKTLTMIALILTQKNQEKNKAGDKNTALTWLSRDGNTNAFVASYFLNCLSQQRVDMFKL